MSLDNLLNTTITVLRKAPVSRDSSGGQAEVWRKVANWQDIPALIQPRSGRAIRTLGQRQVLVTHAIYLLDASEILRGDVILHPESGRRYLVHGIEDMAGQGRAWRIECSLET